MEPQNQQLFIKYSLQYQSTVLFLKTITLLYRTVEVYDTGEHTFLKYALRNSPYFMYDDVHLQRVKGRFILCQAPHHGGVYCEYKCTDAKWHRTQILLCTQMLCFLILY